jgi:hypothetical protein
MVYQHGEHFKRVAEKGQGVLEGFFGARATQQSKLQIPMAQLPEHVGLADILGSGILRP